MLTAGANMKSIMFRSLIVVFAVITLSGCTKKSAGNNQTGQETITAILEFTPDELGYLQSLHNRGFITIATRERSTIYEPNKYAQGEHGGIDYLIAKSFADKIGVELRIIVVNSIREYFTYNGVEPNKDTEDGMVNGTITPYTPDIFTNADIIVDGLGTSEWRRRIIRLVPTIPDKDVIVTRKDIELSTLEEIADYRVAIVPLTIYGSSIKRVEEALGLHFNFVEFSDTPDLCRAVSEGEADVTAIAGFGAIIETNKYDNLKIAFPLGIVDYDHSHWAVSKESEVLAVILEKYIEYAKRSGIYDTVFKDSLGITYNDFKAIIDGL